MKLDKKEHDYLDLECAFANMLDYVASDSILVQRWCAACMHDISHEDHHRNTTNDITTIENNDQGRRRKNKNIQSYFAISSHNLRLIRFLSHLLLMRTILICKYFCR